MVPPETRYARTPDGLSIAYHSIGDGPPDVMELWGFHGNLEIMWEFPLVEEMFEKLSSIGRVIFHDRRGTGLSDRAASLPDLETQADDLRTVLDAVGSMSTVLVGHGEGAFPAAFFASVYPERVAALVLYAASARVSSAPDYPWGAGEVERRHDERLAEDAWGTEAYAASITRTEAPSRLLDRDFIRWYAKMMRHWVTPSSAAQLVRNWYDLDIRAILPTIRVPTLLISRETWDREEDDHIVSLIPGAAIVRLPGNDVVTYVGDQDGFVNAVAAFVGVEREAPTRRGVSLQTVLFTDIVGSTTHLAALGDEAWGQLAQRHHLIVREHLARFRGLEVDTAGDGFFATFDGPARAVRCTQAIVGAVRELGIEVRAGIHTGEVEVVDGKAAGLAVAIGARVASLADASQILVSQTVKDLVAGSGLSFDDVGEHELKGVPDRWRLYRVIET